MSYVTREDHAKALDLCAAARKGEIDLTENEKNDLNILMMSYTTGEEYPEESIRRATHIIQTKNTP